MYHDMCCSAALGGKGGVDIGMGNMPVAGGIEIQRLGSAAGGPDDGGTGPPVQCEHFAARTVDPARLSVLSREPDGVAGFEFHRLRREGLGVALAPLPYLPIHPPPGLRSPVNCRPGPV